MLHCKGGKTPVNKIRMLHATYYYHEAFVEIYLEARLKPGAFEGLNYREASRRHEVFHENVADEFFN